MKEDIETELNNRLDQIQPSLEDVYNNTDDEIQKRIEAQNKMIIEKQNDPVYQELMKKYSKTGEELEKLRQEVYEEALKYVEKQENE